MKIWNLKCDFCTFYKRLLCTLLGKDTIGNFSAFVILLLILLFMLIILILLSVPIMYMFSDTLHCMDSYTELLAKIGEEEDLAQYWLKQSQECELLFKESLKYNDPEDMKQERLSALKECQENYNSKRDIARDLRDKLNSGDYDPDLPTTSSLGKKNSEK